MQSKARNLKKLIDLQKLGSARLELALASTNAHKTELDEEGAALLAMQDRHYERNAFTVDPLLLSRRLGVNAIESRQLESKLELERKALLGEQRRVELLEDRLNELRSDQERREFASLIEEFISRKTAKSEEKQS